MPNPRLSKRAHARQSALESVGEAAVEWLDAMDGLLRGPKQPLQRSFDAHAELVRAASALRKLREPE